MGFIDISLCLMGLYGAAGANIFVWFIYYKVYKIRTRLHALRQNYAAIIRMQKYLMILDAALEITSEKLKFVPELEILEKSLMESEVQDPSCNYTTERIKRKRPALPPMQSKKGSRKSAKSKEEIVNDKFKAPDDPNAEAATKDPNYQTLRMTGNNEDVFGDNKKKEKFKAPDKVEKADAKDPQYETLNGIGNELFNEEENKQKEGKGSKEKADGKEKKKKFVAPDADKVKKADSKDPAYETLADVKDDIFKGGK